MTPTQPFSPQLPRWLPPATASRTGELRRGSDIMISGAAIGPGAPSRCRRALHLLAAAVHAFLTAINLNSWRFYADLNRGAIGYASTAMHVLLATAELVCAARAPDPRVAPIRAVEV